MKKTKPQMRRLCKQITQKSKLLLLVEPDSNTGQIMSGKDYEAIKAIMKRCLNRLK